MSSVATVAGFEDLSTDDLLTVDGGFLSILVNVPLFTSPISIYLPNVRMSNLNIQVGNIVKIVGNGSWR